MKTSTAACFTVANPAPESHDVRPPLFACESADPSIADLLRENADLRRLVAELEEFRTLAYKDPLTGLWNRRYFDERLAEEVDRSRRSATRQLSLMVIDVNDLKRLNDEGGHSEGDRALRAVAAFLRGHLRAHDVCCRTGGDEFAVVLPDVPRAGTEVLTARLRQTMSWECGGRPMTIGVSVGAATLGAQISAADALVRAADRAMYRDKRRQKGRDARLSL
jgi:two-component system cell cycle response regulator